MLKDPRRLKWYPLVMTTALFVTLLLYVGVGLAVKALVVRKPGIDVSEQDLIDHCRAHLAHFKCPTSVEWRESFARTSTGKLQKFKIRAPYWEGRERAVN